MARRDRSPGRQRPPAALPAHPMGTEGSAAVDSALRDGQHLSDTNDVAIKLVRIAK